MELQIDWVFMAAMSATFAVCLPVTGILALFGAAPSRGIAKVILAVPFMLSLVSIPLLVVSIAKIESRQFPNMFMLLDEGRGPFLKDGRKSEKLSASRYHITGTVLSVGECYGGGFLGGSRKCMAKIATDQSVRYEEIYADSAIEGLTVYKKCQARTGKHTCFVGWDKKFPKSFSAKSI